jgi:hypothetical protein
MIQIKNVIFLLFLLLLLPTLCFSSIGDKFSYFQDCTGFCRRDFECPNFYFAYTWTTSPCFQCRQKCIFETVQIFQEKGWKIPQFFGKWPFLAFYLNFGPLFFLIQEPASTIFSLLNLLAVYKMYKRIVREVDEEFRIKSVWKGYGCAGMAVWICSALFHSRDFWLTEYLDYFAACFLIFYAMFAGISFVFPWLQSSYNGKKVWAAIGTSIMLFFFGHVYSLLTDFDYGHNMFYCISASLITAGIYLFWFVREVSAGRGRRSLGALFLLIAIGLGSALFEILDFPPIFWTFDAHSLFHAATIPTPLLLAEFAILEAKYEQDLTKTRMGKEY